MSQSKNKPANPARLDDGETVWIGSSAGNRVAYHTNEKCHNYQNISEPKCKDWEVVKRMELKWCPRCRQLAESRQVDGDTVLVKVGKNGNSYHKRAAVDPDEPACCVNGKGHEDTVWHKWSIEKAKVWKDACQNPECYGEEHTAATPDSDAAWPV